MSSNNYRRILVTTDSILQSFGLLVSPVYYTLVPFQYWVSSIRYCSFLPPSLWLIGLKSSVRKAQWGNFFQARIVLLPSSSLQCGTHLQPSSMVVYELCRQRKVVIYPYNCLFHTTSETDVYNHERILQ